MQQEDSWVTTKMVGEDDNMAATTYSYFMRPEPFDDLGPIRIIDDKYLGKTKVRDMRVGMVRNAKDEDKKSITAYLQPFPHTRINTAKPLQGWYKSLHEPAGVRPRPCFSEAILTEPYGGYCAVGCAFCLPGSIWVQTPYGMKLISQLREGDSVFGRTWKGVEEVEVLGVSRRVAEETVRFTLSNGQDLECTPDHLVWSQTEMEWKRADNFEVGEEMQSLSGAYNEREENLLFKDLLVSDKPAEKKTRQNLRMREDHSKEQKSLRRLCIEDSFGERKENKGSTEFSKGTAKIRGDKEANELTCSKYKRRDVSKSLRAKVSRMEGSSSRTGKVRNLGIQALQAGAVYLSKEQEVCNEVSLGESSSSFLGYEENKLGLRAIRHKVKDRRLSTRLCFRRRINNRSQGILYAQGQSEDGGSQETGLLSRDLRQKKAGGTRNPYVKNIERIQKEIEVYDIQTSCENFYAEGVLVHNCYINSGIRGYRGSGLITVPLNYGEQIAKQLSKNLRGAAGYFSSFTDPFTPLEYYYHNTQNAAIEFVKQGLPIFFLSRLRYPQWAIDLMQKNPHSYAQKSINTPDAEDWRLLSPGALPLKDHLKDIARLKAAGIYVSIQCNPILPGVTSHTQVMQLFNRLKEAGADHVIVKFVEAGYSWAPAMAERILKRFGPVRGGLFAELFTENIGGQRTIQEAYRMEGHRKYAAHAKRIGLTYATCYEYEYERDAQGEIKNKTGVSVGRKFTTASQCHGQTVPVYSRDSVDELFQPVAECPPSGCLYCASENNGKARCGDNLAGEANAVSSMDMRVAIGQGKARNENNSALVQLKANFNE